MSDTSAFDPPEITDGDVRWASDPLELPKTAFYGLDGTDPRQEVLKSMERIDVAACPGSGKTTLLVAKLAILAEKWRYRTRGICVLSHTNAARREVETRLPNTAAGYRLLSYPHFIETIHKFVNTFLALPWLRAKRYPVKIIDDDEVERRRRCLLGRRRFSALRTFVESNEKHTNLVGSWIVGSPEFAVFKINGQPAFKNPGAASDQLARLAESVIREGYHRHAEMFMWAHDFMDMVPSIVSTLRDRFPLLFIDEAQDNSEAQSTILHRIFMDRGDPVRRQRFGDANQAIFNFVGDKGATTDVFPDDAVTSDLPNSHRFGQMIADLADPLGITPYGLKGQGPKMPLASGELNGPHTVFLFGDGNGRKVLDAYGELLIRTFSEQELREGTFTAVGQVHRPPDTEERHKPPHHVGDYWPDYDPELSKADPRPRTFVQHVLAGRARAVTTGEAFPAVQMIAEGILRLAGMGADEITMSGRRNCHRRVLQHLEESAAHQACYTILISRFALGQKPLTRKTWNDRWRYAVRGIAEAVARVQLSGEEVDAFLAWTVEPDSGELPPTIRRNRDNIYAYPRDAPKVSIRVGSIHSIKGKTHTATLVLETFWQDKKERHNLELLLPWLTRNKTGSGSAGVHQRTRLKLHYVAMTRPTHLVCLAMKRSTFENSEGNLDPELLGQMEQRGWHVESVR